MNQWNDLLDRIQALEQRSDALERQSDGRHREPKGQIATVSESTETARRGAREVLAPGTPDPAEARRQAKPNRVSGRRRLRRRPIRDPDGTAAAHTPGPPRIAGVRIAYIGAQAGSIARIRDYWERRGAVFMPYPTLEDTSLEGLDRQLGSTDNIFFCPARVGEEVALRLQAYCDRTEKALIPLHNAGLSGHRRALGSWCPLS